MCSTANQQDSYLLAMSWQPGFCEHTPRTSGKPECAAMDKGSLVVSNLTLHGLWPNKKACGTSYGNCDGKPFALKKETVALVAPWMPNFYYENSFGKYEWNKHGTCQSLDPDAYFTKAVAAVKLVNSSAIGEQILKNIGGSFNADKFFATLRSQYGEAAASRVMLVCAGRTPGDYIGGGKKYLYLADAATVSVSGNRFTVDINSNGANWNGTFVGMNSLTELKPGYYGGLQRYPFHNAVKGGLSWGGNGRGCNTLTATSTAT
eukprot:gene33243-41016_t